MKLPSILSHAAFRGPRTLALAALTVALLAAGASASSFYGNATPLPDVSIAAQDYLLGFRVTVTSAGTLEAFGVDFRSVGDQASFGLYAADGGFGEPGTLVAQTGSFAVTGAGVVEVPATASAALAVGDYWIMAVYSVDTQIGYDLAGADTIDYQGLAFSGSLPSPFGAATSYVGGKIGYYIKVATQVATAIYTKGDAVPGVTPAVTFTGFGVPSINAAGQVAFLGKWSGGAGIFASGALVAKVGDSLAVNMAIKSLKDPALSESGRVIFPCTLIGTGITPVNDAAIASNEPGGLPVIVAQEGTQAPDAPVGALWKSFTSVALPFNSSGIILGFMAGGGVTTANDNGLWAADSAGVFHLLLQEGTTVIGGKTVKSFSVLKAVSGTPGQTHAFNGAQELVAKVTYTTGEQGIVHVALP